MIIDLTIFPVLATERLILRQLSMSDAYEIMMLRSNKEVNEFLGRPASITIEEAIKFIEKIEKVIANNEGAYWAITIKGVDKLIGTLCYWNISLDKNMAEIGYELYPTFQGKGIMQEAISAVIKYGFDKMKLDVITALPEAGNTRSIRVLLKNNFREDVKNEWVAIAEAEGLSVYYLTRNP